MANKSSPLAQAGATPAKLALIGVLGVVLVAVLFVQFRGSGGDTPSPPAGNIAARGQTETGRPKAEMEPDRGVATTPPERVSTKISSKWRPPELPAVIQHDPFALPASFPQPRSMGVEESLARLGDSASDQSEEAIASREERMQRLRAELDALRQLGVQMIVRQDEGYVAMIGDRTIHVGDEIQGFTVIAIDADGVRVARDLKP